MNFIPILIPSGKRSGRNEGYNEAFNEISNRETYAVGRFLAKNEHFRRGVDQGITTLRDAIGDVDKAVPLSEIESAGGKWRLSVMFTKANSEQAPALRDAAKAFVLDVFRLDNKDISNKFYKFLGRSHNVSQNFEVGQALDYIGSLDEHRLYNLGRDAAQITVLDSLGKYSEDDDYSWDTIKGAMPDMSRYERECTWIASMQYAGKLLDKIESGLKTVEPATNVAAKVSMAAPV